jgi:hypothetical protein
MFYILSSHQWSGGEIQGLSGETAISVRLYLGNGKQKNGIKEPYEVEKKVVGGEKAVEEGESNECENRGVVDNIESDSTANSKTALSRNATHTADASDKTNIDNENINNLKGNADSGSCIPESEDFVVPPIGKIYDPRSFSIVFFSCLFLFVSLRFS